MKKIIDWADADDPVEELHKLRRQMLKEAGGIEGYMRQIMEYQKQHPERIVDLSREAAQKRAKSVARKPGQRRRAAVAK